MDVDRMAAWHAQFAPKAAVAPEPLPVPVEPLPEAAAQPEPEPKAEKGSAKKGDAA